MERVQKILQFTRVCARKHPVAGWTLPTLVSFGVGLVFMQLTNPANQDLSQIEKRAQHSKQPLRWQDTENKSDPFAAPAANQTPSPPRQHKTWQAQYIQEMLDGLKDKTRAEKLDDAFYALDQFMKPGNQRQE